MPNSPYIVTQPPKDKQAALDHLAEQIADEHASPSRSAMDEAEVAHIDAAAKMMMEPRDIADTIKTAKENGLIAGYEDIARINREEAAMRDEIGQGKPTLTWGQNGMTEARGSMAVHLMLERDPSYGPKWYKDDKKFARFLREFPEARTYNKRGSK